MMNRPTSIAYIDLLSVCFVLFAVLTAALLVEKIAKEQGNTEMKAEFAIRLTWHDNSPSDVDLWVQNPLGDTLYYSRRSIGLMTLDHDDQGSKTDTIIDANGNKIVDPEREEIATIRGIVPGVYSVNTVMYSKREDIPVVATVEIVKLNPYSVVIKRQVVITDQSQKDTIASFTLDEMGNVLNVDSTTEVSMTP